MNLLNYKNIIISKLFAIGAIKKGTFLLKSGKTSNLYFDMRIIMSYPNLFHHLMSYFFISNPQFLDDIDIIAGIHFGGLPLANFISHKYNIPQVYIRDSTKDYGLSKEVEGVYCNNDKLLLIDDVMTSGGSLKEKINILDKHKIRLGKILVILDRSENIDIGHKVHSILTLKDINDYMNEKLHLYYENILSNQLYQLAIRKETNIILSCDYDDGNKILDILDYIGNNILGVKLHADLIKNFNDKFVDGLRHLKQKYNLIIIEDRKLADIGTIAVKQLEGTHRINEWADYITAHPISGVDMFKAIQDRFPSLGIIMVSEMSSKGNLIDTRYTQRSVEMVPYVSGIVSQSNIYKFMNPFDTPTLSPGINLDSENDQYGQQYKSCNTKQLYDKGLFWIIGRGICNSKNIYTKAEEYKKYGWEYFKNY